jgi:hypothetical protein
MMRSTRATILRPVVLLIGLHFLGVGILVWGLNLFYFVYVDTGPLGYSLHFDRGYIQFMQGHIDPWHIGFMRESPHLTFGLPRLDWNDGRPNATIPCWLLILIGACLLGVARLRGPHRSVEPLCAHCGYNLTNNVSGTCPECGKLLPKRIAKVDIPISRARAVNGDAAH